MKVCVKQSLLMLLLFVALPAWAVVSPGQNMWGIVQQTADTVDELSETVSIIDATINTLASGCATTPITTAMTITTSGSYCLANNITSFITINSDGVTLDLNGFSILNSFVLISSGHKNICIKNGFISGPSSFGILVDANNSNLIISDIQISGISGVGSRGIAFVATNTFSNTIQNFTIKNCAIRECSAQGIQLNGCINGEVRDCVVENVGTQGIVLIGNSTNVILDNCSVQKAGGAAFSSGTFGNGGFNCRFNRCTAIESLVGFSLLSGTNFSVMSCCAINNQTGFSDSSGTNNAFVNNFALRNGTNYSIGATPDAPLTSSTDATMNYWKNYQVS